MNNSYNLSADELEIRVKERTAELEKSNRVLRAEILERKRVENELIKTREKLETDIRGIGILHRLSTRHPEGDRDLSSILRGMVEAAIAITGADKGSIQILDPSDGKLRIVAQMGFGNPILESLESLDLEETDSYKTAVERMESVIVEDITQSSIFNGSNSLSLLKNEGIRAVMFTPLFSRSGELLGFNSVFFGQIHMPAERELILIDILARQAADIIEWKSSKEPLHYSEQPIKLKSETVVSPSGEAVDLKLSEIVDARAIQSLMDDFNKLTHISVGLNDLNGNVLACAGWQDICTKFHRIHPETCKHCIESDINLSCGIVPGEFKLYRCKNNMWDISTPVTVCGQQIGILFTGQFFFNDEPLDYEFFRSQARKYGFNEGEYIAALEKVPRLSRETVETSITFLMKFANMISQINYSNIKLSHSLAERDCLIEALRESENRERARSDELAAVLDSVPAAVWIAHDPEALRITGNRFSCELLNTPKDTNFSKSAPVGERPEMFRLIKNGVEIPPAEMPLQMSAAGRELNDYEIDIVTSDGRIRHVLGNSRPLRDERGNPRGSVAAFIDITDRKRSEDAIKKSRAILAKSQEMAHVGNWAWNVQTGEMNGSDEIYRIYGYEPGDVRLGEEWVMTRVHPDDRALFSDFIHSVKMEGMRGSLDYRIVRLNSDARFVTSVADKIVRDRDGKVKWVYGITQDITDRKQAEQELKASELRFKALVQELESAVFLIDSDGKFAIYNPAFLRVFNISEKELEHMKIQDLLWDKWNVVDKDGNVLPFEFHPVQFARLNSKPVKNQIIGIRRYPHDDWIWTLASAEPILNPDGSINVLICTFTEITQLKNTEDALRESEQRFRSVLENSPDAVYQINLQNESFDYISPVVEQITGFPVREMSSMSFDEFSNHICPEDRPLVETAFTRAMKSGTGAFDYRFKHKNGEYRWLTDQINVMKDQNGQPRFIRGMISDITEQKKAEKVLRLSNLYNRSLIEASLDPLVTIGRDGKIKDVNGATEQVTGFSRNDLIGTDFSDYFTEPENARKGYQRVFIEGKVWDYPLEIQHKDGHITPVLYNASVYRDENGEIMGVFAAARDITERKKVEAALRKVHDNLENLVEERTEQLENAYNSLKESEKGLAEAQEMAHVGNWRWDITTNELLWSDEVYRIFGLSPQELKITYDLFLSFVHPEDRNCLINAISAGLNERILDVEYRIVLADGEERIVHTKAESISYEGNIPVHAKGIIQDITERKKAEKELEKVNKIRIKEIHHRIKNNLQVISSLLDLQAEKLQNKEFIEDTEVQEAFKESQNRIFSMSLIHEELYKGEGTDKLNFSAYVQRLAGNLFQAYRVKSRKIRLYMDLEENSFFDMDTAIPLGIIVNELVSNSLKHAFDEDQEGIIRIRLCREAQKIEIDDIFESFFSLTISDNGKGIPEVIKFDELESLGLQLVNILVDQLDGKIEIKREHGTEFKIIFKITERS